MAHTNTAFVQAKNGTVADVVVALGTAPFDFSTANLLRAAEAIVVANTNGIVITWEGTNPTATLGMPVAAGSHYVVEGRDDIPRVRIISKDTVAADVTVFLKG